MDGHKKDRKKKASGIIYTILLTAALAAFVITGILLLQRFNDDAGYEAEASTLKSMIGSSGTSGQGNSASENGSASGTSGNNEGTPAGGTADGAAEASSGQADYKSRYAELLSKNPEFIGWIKIDDTNVDLPVVWRKGDDDYYLHHDFNLDGSVYGVPFLSGEDNPDPAEGYNNFIIYGHHIKTGLVFSNLEKYRDQSFADAHPTVSFNTIYEDGTYEIFGACAVGINTDTDFKYYDETKMVEKEFNAFIGKIRERSLISMGIVPKYGDRLLTLSTCEYTHKNGRFVLFARKK